MAEGATKVRGSLRAPAGVAGATFRFVDFFAGLGGFHVALDRLGGECVLACELDESLRELYNRNFSVVPEEDIRALRISEIPLHDVLCAGFPCQSFSKAGSQAGLGCLRNGDLITYVTEIARAKQPRYLLLENVANLAKHDGGDTWKLIKEALVDAGYAIDSRILSPDQFGIPQVRERLFIVGCREGLSHFSWPEPSSKQPCIRSVLEKSPAGAKPITKDLERCLNVWQKFLDLYPEDEELPSFPIWSMEFGADYPYEHIEPASLALSELRRYRGCHGKPITGRTRDEVLLQLPSYARGEEELPTWKKTFIRQNRELYARNKVWIDQWKEEVLEFAPSLQKFEWNCKGEVRDLWQHVIQIRASGVRVKRDTTAPSLIAMTTTQVPIIAWEKRYMTPRECAALQSLPPDMNLPETATGAYKALGNAVNAELVHKVAASLLSDRLSTAMQTSPQAAL